MVGREGKSCRSLTRTIRQTTRLRILAYTRVTTDCLYYSLLLISSGIFRSTRIDYATVGTFRIYYIYIDSTSSNKRIVFLLTLTNVYRVILSPTTNTLRPDHRDRHHHRSHVVIEFKNTYNVVNEYVDNFY